MTDVRGQWGALVMLLTVIAGAVLACSLTFTDPPAPPPAVISPPPMLIMELAPDNVTCATINVRG